MFHEIKNLKKAAKRIKQAVKNQERIIIFADADLDGTTSTVILEETIKNIGGGVFLVYFPNRDEEGYGLSEQALNSFKEQTPALLIVLDCGIGSFEGVFAASQAGLEVIIIDHHEILDKLPSPALIVDPKQPKDNYPFKKLTTVSIVYKLSQELLGTKMFLPLQKSFFELAALGTIADMMPEEDYNKKVIEGGLAFLLETFRPGLFAMISLIKKEGDTTRQIFQKLSSVLNITGMKGRLTESYLLFQEKEPVKARQLSEFLIEESEKRQLRIQDIVSEIQQRIEKKGEACSVFEGSQTWEQLLTGPVASRICNRLGKPTFIFKIGKEKCRGSVRMPHKMDAVVALKACSAFLEVYGGHPPAAGFTTSKDKIEGLEKCLEEYFKQN
ncbi:MAG: DHH family phosphoesterase [Candidatus Pacebacteria bacterium]|nr:DHH family phosphoesterase [Candidatus Paceibacterota bacterium]